MDLSYKNKAGISLQNILDVLQTQSKATKKDIQNSLGTVKSIDTLLNKLEDNNLITKEKVGNKIIFMTNKVADVKVETAPKTKSSKNKIVEPETIDEIKPIKTIKKATPKNVKTPGEVKIVNEMTKIVSEKHQITSVIEIDETKEKSKPTRDGTPEIDEEGLQILKREMELRTGKEITVVLHKRNERPYRERKATVEEIYNQQEKMVAESKNTPPVGNDLEQDNPYRFLLNFFTSTFNAEKATPFFRRRDDYVVKSIFNKLKTLCISQEDYIVDPQSLPFYRVLTINTTDMTIKMYHIDMNRIVRGSYTIYKIKDSDKHFIKLN